MNREHEHCLKGLDTNEPSARPSHLQCREIQAPVAACLIRAFASVMGFDEALEVATAAVQAEALITGRNMAEQYGGNGTAALAWVVREIWAENGAMTILFLQEAESNLSFDVTRCRYAESYEKMGMKELGFCLSCSRDEPFARGFNPRLKLLRTQTIMQGAPFCDFRFTLE
jgi:hypothetical protein